jgi:hypothetical protein
MAIIRFAFVVENEVSHMLELDESIDSPVIPRLIQTYRNNTNPTFVETTNDNIQRGWSWDGTEFFPPEA